MEEIKAIINSQYQFFKTGKTLDVNFRLEQLKKLKRALINNENEIITGLYKDLGKSPFETYTCEFGILMHEINVAIKSVKEWAKPKRARVGMINFPSKGIIYPSPRGVALIMTPWNYPLYLSISPLISSICAGDCTILKMSRYSSYTSIVIENMLFEVFETEYIAVLQGGRKTNEFLLSQKYDFIFFTGSSNVGKIVLESAAKNLTPVVLELGGKNPCVVTKHANIKAAARRITWGKFINCGQTCVAPDYLLVERSVKKQLVEEIINNILKFYGAYGLQSPDYGKIIMEKHFNRLKDLLKDGDIIYGGNLDEANNKIVPTLMENIKEDSLLLSEEIFGPILPVFEFDNLSEAFSQINKYSNEPLAAYVFTTRKSEKKAFLRNVVCGGGCINDTIMHLVSPYLPFGGVGQSGMGRANGYEGFKAFSNLKTFLSKNALLEIKLKYPPYEQKLGKIRKILR